MLNRIKRNKRNSENNQDEDFRYFPTSLSGRLTTFFALSVA